MSNEKNVDDVQVSAGNKAGVSAKGSGSFGGITTENLTMRFKQVTAVNDFSTTFEAGKIYGLLGRNGAGKTTLLNLISNRLIPTAGKVYIDGEPSFENERVLSRIFYVGEKQLMPEDTKVKDYFAITARFFGFDTNYAMQLSEAFKLDTKKRLSKLSTGYSTIAKLICALATNATYLLLDEPVLGLDANHRALFYSELLANYANHPRTIVLSTHLIEEISGIIEEVVIIDAGKLMLSCSAEEMRAMGYEVSGKAEDVDAYCADKQVLGVTVLGALKSASILGAPDNLPNTLSLTSLDMQKMFVHLTNANESNGNR